ncbi:MAG: hypothetical protein H7X99_09890, partial [Saprospiraceae bacterium]|nr:hypothetical protein [Saprospiraceae bacterium]
FDGVEPVFAKRYISTYETSLCAKFNFTNRMGVTLVGRHYVRALSNKNLFYLNEDGILSENELNPLSNDRTANYFNIDMVYTWQIAQGSFVNVVWKNSIGKFDVNNRSDYFANLTETLKEDQNNNVSLKLIYFLDYHTMVNRYKS